MSSRRRVAFLRAINVGGHVVKMDALRAIFATIGLRNVETFIASGNVIFEASGSDPVLEKKIETALQKELGYAVTTFVRSVEELGEIARRTLFAPKDLDAGKLSVAFLKSPASAETMRKLAAVGSPIDDFRAEGREIYWLCRATHVSDSKFMGPLFEKTIGAPATVRNINTVRKLVEKYAV